MELVISHRTDTDRWLQERHYLHSTPAGAVIRMEFLEDGQRIGAGLLYQGIHEKGDGAMIWFLILIGISFLIPALVSLIPAAGNEDEIMWDWCEVCPRWIECNGVDEECPWRK